MILSEHKKIDTWVNNFNSHSHDAKTDDIPYIICHYEIKETGNIHLFFTTEFNVPLNLSDCFLAENLEITTIGNTIIRDNTIPNSTIFLNKTCSAQLVYLANKNNSLLYNIELTMRHKDLYSSTDNFHYVPLIYEIIKDYINTIKNKCLYETREHINNTVDEILKTLNYIYQIGRNPTPFIGNPFNKTVNLGAQQHNYMKKPGTEIVLYNKNRTVITRVT